MNISPILNWGSWPRYSWTEKLCQRASGRTREKPRLQQLIFCSQSCAQIFLSSGCKGSLKSSLRKASNRRKLQVKYLTQSQIERSKSCKKCLRSRNRTHTCQICSLRWNRWTKNCQQNLWWETPKIHPINLKKPNIIQTKKMIYQRKHQTLTWKWPQIKNIQMLRTKIRSTMRSLWSSSSTPKETRHRSILINWLPRSLIFFLQSKFKTSKT